MLKFNSCFYYRGGEQLKEEASPKDFSKYIYLSRHIGNQSLGMLERARHMGVGDEASALHSLIRGC